MSLEQSKSHLSLEQSRELSAAREKELIDIADTLLDVRRNGTSIDQIDPAIAPQSLQEAYFVQDVMAQAFGEIGGWKISSAGPEGVPFFAPMPLIWIAPSGSTIKGAHRLHGLEAEIAYQIGTDLPPRATPYTREEVVAAIAAAHPVFEILEAALTSPTESPRFSTFADMQMHGGFVYGPATANWQSIDWSQESVTISVDGAVQVQRTGSNPAGNDLLRLVIYLANEGSVRTGGLRRGQWITTGSWVGNIWSHAGAVADIHFTHAGHVNLRFA